MRPCFIWAIDPVDQINRLHRRLIHFIVFLLPKTINVGGGHRLSILSLMLIKVNDGLLLRAKDIHLLDEARWKSISAFVDGDHPFGGHWLSVVLAIADLPQREGNT